MPREQETQRLEEMRQQIAPTLRAIVELEAAEKGLTPRQAKILALIVDGHPNDRIAGRVGMPCREVQAHLNVIMRRFGVTCRSRLIAKLFRVTS